MFTQKISMDCTKEQYEKYLKYELLKMGYQEVGLSYWGDYNDYLTNYFGIEGEVGNINEQHIRTDNITYLGSFNAPLFLALAAMTDKAEGNYGEYIIGLHSGRFYKMTEGERILPEYNLIRKATKEELMEKFGGEIWNQNKSTDAVDAISYSVGRMPKDNRIYKLNEKGQVEINVLFGATETTEKNAINLLKSKGYKILKPKTWEEV